MYSNQSPQIRSWLTIILKFLSLTMILDLIVMIFSISRGITWLMNLQSEFSNLQVFHFVNLSQDYYQCNMADPHPLFIAFPPARIMAGRHRKLLKLQAQKQQSLARKREADPQNENLAEENQKQNILQHLSQQNLSDLEKESQIEVESFDSEVHDIYNNNTLQSKFRLARSSDGLQVSILDIKLIKQSDLIIDFKCTKKDYMTLRIAQLQQQIKQSQTKNNESIPKSPYLNIASPIQKKQKKTSFIGYYNSLQKKQPSKILERYIKQKK